MNKFKKLYILLGVLVVICAAAFGISKYEAHKEDIRNSDETILEIAGDSVTSLSWEYEGETLSFHKDEKWLYDADEAFPVDEERLSAMLEQFEAFGASFAIENVEDYSQYGLDEPLCTIKLTAREQSYEIKLGDYSKMDSQKALLSKCAADHGLKNTVFFVDDGYSVTNFNRPGFQEMMKHVEDYGVSSLIVKDLSRLGREYSYMGRLQDFIFPAYDVRFIAINDNVDSAKGENDFAVFKNVFNDYYAKDTSNKIRAVVKLRGEAGEHIVPSLWVYQGPRRQETVDC